MHLSVTDGPAADSSSVPESCSSSEPERKTKYWTKDQTIKLENNLGLQHKHIEIYNSVTKIA